MLGWQSPDECPYCGSDKLDIQDAIAALSCFGHTFMPLRVTCKKCGKGHGQLVVLDQTDEVLLVLQFAEPVGNDNAN